MIRFHPVLDRLMHALTETSRRGSVRVKLMATLFVAQVCGSTGHAIGMAVGSIMAASITGTNTWSGLPIAVGALGTALASWPLARLMARSGRRPGLALGYGLAVIGAVLGLLGVAGRSFTLMLVGMALFGDREHLQPARPLRGRRREPARPARPRDGPDRLGLHRGLDHRSQPDGSRALPRAPCSPSRRPRAHS